jgi:hypothetical protein
LEQLEQEDEGTDADELDQLEREDVAMEKEVSPSDEGEQDGEGGDRQAGSTWGADESEGEEKK